MAAVQQPHTEEEAQQLPAEHASASSFNAYRLGANDYEDFDDEHDEILPDGRGYYTVDSDFPPGTEDLQNDYVGMRNGVRKSDEDAEMVIQGDEYDQRIKLALNEYNNFLDNEEPMTLNVLPLFQQAESNDFVYEEPLKPAKLVGKYLIGADLGEGSYGKVKDTLDTETLVRRAVKILRQKRLRKIPNGEQNVLREIALHRELEHTNVVRLADVLRVSCSNTPNGAEKVLANVASSPANLLDPTIKLEVAGGSSSGCFRGGASLGTMSSSDEKLYVIMEYCATGLQQVIDSVPNRRLPEWQAHRYFQQLLEGLQYLHSKGIIHKDIKPGNLLVGNDGNIKICDFGVAEKLSPFAPNDLIEGSQGSPIVQPPEVANGESPFHGFKLDVWSAGVTLYCILAGCFPFEGDNIYQVFQAVARGVYSVPGDFDSGLQQLIRGMLAYSAEERLSLDEVCLHDWVRRRHPCTGSNVSLAQWNRPSTVLTSLEKHGCPPIDLFLPNMAGVTLSVPQSPQLGSPNATVPRLSLPVGVGGVFAALNGSGDDQQLEGQGASSTPNPQRNGAISPAGLPISPSMSASPVRRSTRRAARRTTGQGSGRKLFRRMADQCSLS